MELTVENVALSILALLVISSWLSGRTLLARQRPYLASKSMIDVRSHRRRRAQERTIGGPVYSSQHAGPWVQQLNIKD